MKNTSRNDFLFLAAITVIHAIYFALAWHHGNIFNGDSFEYITEAINIKEYNFFYSGNPALPIEDEYKTLRTPGYPFFLLFVYMFLVNNWLVLVIQNIISICNVWFARCILRDLEYARKVDWLLLLFVVFFPSQFVYANTIAPDLLLQTFCLMYFSQAIVFFRTGKAKNMAMMCIAIIIGLFVKPVLYPLAFIHFLVFTIYLLIHRRRITRATLLTILPVLAVCLYSFWNQTRTGKFHFTSIQSFNAIYYYNNYLKSTESLSSARQFLEAERSEIASLPSFKERYEHAQQRGFELLKQEPLAYLKFHLQRSAAFFLETGKGEMELFLGFNSLGKLYADESTGLKDVVGKGDIKGIAKYIAGHPISFFAIAVFCVNILRLAGFALFVYYFKGRPIVRWFIVLFVLYFALITGPISNAHYVLPISLILMGCASIGLSRLLTVKNNRPIITQ